MNNVQEFIEKFGSVDKTQLYHIIRTLPHVRENGKFKYTQEDIYKIREYFDNRDSIRKAIIDVRHLPASKMYRVDQEYSRHPTGKCENPELGLPMCEKGENGNCYCRSSCPSKISNDPRENDKNNDEVNRMVKECQDRHKEELDEFERQMNAYDYDEMVKQILGYK